MGMRRAGLALGLVLGAAADAMFGDPVRGHPVAGFGSAATRAEQRLWADSRPRGVAFALLTTGPALAAVAPLFWGAVCGVPGLLGHRAVNTLDAMVGHRSPRYERFGWAAARLDDLTALAPARLTALLAIALAPAVGGSARNGLSVLGRDGRKHPSPNAGRCEAAFAGVLGVQLGGLNVYDGRAESRGLLGDGPLPGPADIRRAVRLSRLIGAAAAVLAASCAWERR
jgi:cobalamin biosynthesis protein CobD/CbiB